MATGSFHLDQLAPMVNRWRWAMDRDQLRTCLAKLPGGAARWRCGAWWELGLRSAVLVDKENHDRLWLICCRFRANHLRVPLYLFMLSTTGKGNRGTHAPSGPGEQITKERRSKAVYELDSWKQGDRIRPGCWLPELSSRQSTLAQGTKEINKKKR